MLYLCSWFLRRYDVSHPNNKLAEIVVTATRGERGVYEMKYRVHRFEMNMNSDLEKLELFLNNLQGEVVAVVPITTATTFKSATVDFLLIIEKLP